MAQLMMDLETRYGPWQITHKGDWTCKNLADRHYTRQKKGARFFTRPGKNLVLRTPEGNCTWVSWLGIRDDGFDAIECTLFRNESPSRYLSSVMIKYAIYATLKEWDVRPKDGFITYCDHKKVDSQNAGYCFIRGGFKKLKKKSKKGKTILQADFPMIELIFEEMRSAQYYDHCREMVQVAIEGGELYEAPYFQQEAMRTKIKLQEIKQKMKAMQMKAWKNTNILCLGMS